jgi:uncharacterized protein
MFLKFHDRDDELSYLSERYRSDQFEFFVIYGRRRVGKTELIKRFIQNKTFLYYLCDKSGTERNSIRLKKQIAETINEPVIETNDLEGIIEYYLKKTRGLSPIIVFDEFSYLVEKDASIPSLFQRIVDEQLRYSDALLILCGSSISMMEKGVLSAKSALYGRKTAHLKLKEIPFSVMPLFFPNNSIEKNMEFYATLGGVPFYLQRFSDKKTTWENIQAQILDKTGYLYEEIDFLLREELREPDTYKTILQAIATGRSKLVDIANASQIKANDIDKYLKILIRLGIIAKCHPIDKQTSKKTIYTISDNFFAFYFSFSDPYCSSIEIGEIAEVKQRFEEQFSAYVGKRFEKLIRDEILWKLPDITPQRVGRWWGAYKDKGTGERKEAEIDIIAIDETKNHMIFGECKWQNKPMGVKTYEQLLFKKDLVEWKRNTRTESFVLFSKNGFTKELRKKAEDSNIFLYDLKDIPSILRSY